MCKPPLLGSPHDISNAGNKIAGVKNSLASVLRVSSRVDPQATAQTAMTVETSKNTIATNVAASSIVLVLFSSTAVKSSRDGLKISQFAQSC
jgi:hypothetical protein